MFLHQGSIVLDILRLETLGKIIRLSGKDLKCQLWDLTAAGWAPGGARQSSLEAGCVLGSHSRCTQPHLAKMRELVLEMPGFQAIRRLNLQCPPHVLLHRPLFFLHSVNRGLKGAWEGVSAYGGEGQCARLGPRRPDGSVRLVWKEAAVLPGGRGGQQRGLRQVREPLPGWKQKGGLRVCSQAGNHPRPPTKSPGEAGPAPGLEEEAAGDSAISRGLGARVPQKGR